MSLRNTVALITGASRGLGREVALLYAQAGARLVIVARDATALHEAARDLAAVAPQADVLEIAADVSEDAERIAAAALQRFGHVDLLLNNASTIGASPMPALDTLSWAMLADMLRVNVLAPLHLTQLLLPSMRARGQGLIVNISSDAAVNAYPGWGGYATTKAALEHMSRVLAAELEGSGVVVRCVDPGDMNTRMHAEAEPGVDLSHLPPPSVPAPFFVALAESPGREAYRRDEAMAVLAGR